MTTPERDVAAIRERHSVTSTQNPAGPGWTPIAPFCVTDDQPWPCDVAVLLSSPDPVAGDGLRAALDDLVEAFAELDWENAGVSDEQAAAWHHARDLLDAASLSSPVEPPPGLADEVANLSTSDLPRHGVIEYDDHDEWLTESDAEGAVRIVARDVPRWFGRLVEAALLPTQASDSPEKTT